MRPGLGSKMDGRRLGVLLLHRVSETRGLFGDRSITKLQRADFPKAQILEIWSGQLLQFATNAWFEDTVRHF